MKLNADILYDYLNPVIPFARYGNGLRSLHLCRPEFYSGDSVDFLSNHLYITLADRLPDNPRFGSGVVLICVGGLPPVWYTTGRCVCFSTKEPVDMYTVFNSVQQLFNTFDTWSDELLRIQAGNLDIAEMIRISTPVIGLPVVVLDKGFSLIASSADPFPTETGESRWEAPEINLESFSKAMEQAKIDMTTRTPVLLGMAPEALCENLFDQQNTYVGSLTFLEQTRPVRPSDYELIDYLSQFIVKALIVPSTGDSDRLSTLKAIISDLLQGLPSNPKRVHRIEDYKPSADFIAVKMVLVGKMHLAPLRFICDLIESSIPGTIALPYEGNAVGFLEVNNMETTIAQLQNFIDKVDVEVGISQVFQDLLQARSHYRQASIAIEFGEHFAPGKRFHRFSDYRLQYLLSHCTGEFALETLLPDGLRAIFERDAKFNSDYRHTLEVYLDNHMNVSKTATELFLHRSSLLDRLKRIEKYLNMDMDDPSQRLQIQILLKVAEQEKQIHQTR